jgi:hypothetical protein
MKEKFPYLTPEQMGVLLEMYTENNKEKREGFIKGLEFCGTNQKAVDFLKTPPASGDSPPIRRKRAKMSISPLIEPEPKVYKKVVIDGIINYFEILKKHANDEWSIRWFYTEENLLETNENSNRETLYSGCVVSSTHVQHDFYTENIEDAPELSVVGHFDLDKNQVLLDDQYEYCIKRMKTFLARGGGEMADKWTEIAWYAHKELDEIYITKMRRPVHEKICGICGLPRTVSYKISAKESTYTVGCDCAGLFEAATEVVRNYNNPEQREDCLKILAEIHTTETE